MLLSPMELFRKREAIHDEYIRALVMSRSLIGISANVIPCRDSLSITLRNTGSQL